MSAPYQGLGPTLAECLTAEKIALTAELAQVKAERDEAVRRWAAEVNEQTGVIFELRADCAAFKKLLDDVAAVNAEMRAERDTAIRHLRNAERVVYDSAYRAEVEAFLLSMREKADQ
jgi:glutaredoxin 2